MINLNKYNDVRKLFRVTTWILRFVNNLKGTRKAKEKIYKTEFLLSEEISNAKNIWIKRNQVVLRADNKFQDLVNMLYLVEENDGIMRSHGRLMNAKLPYKTKVPIVLSRKHKLANLLVIDSHTKVLHNGVRQTFTEFRSSYWIPKAKSFVKKILYHCTVCRRFNSRSYDYPKSPNLPSIRLRGDVTFSGTGVDYLGPIYCKNVYSDDLDDENESHKVMFRFTRVLQ